MFLCGLFKNSRGGILLLWMRGMINKRAERRWSTSIAYKNLQISALTDSLPFISGRLFISVFPPFSFSDFLLFFELSLLIRSFLFYSYFESFSHYSNVLILYLYSFSSKSLSSSFSLYTISFFVLKRFSIWWQPSLHIFLKSVFSFFYFSPSSILQKILRNFWKLLENVTIY